MSTAGGCKRSRRRAWMALQPLGRMTDPGFESRVTWVFGSPRSGSSWLLELLAEHPRVVPVNEPLIGYYLTPFLGDHPGFDPRALEPDTFTLRRVNRRGDDEFFAERYRRVWRRRLGQLLNDRFHAQLWRSTRSPVARSSLVIKEPNGSQSADLIMSAMPRARLLFLLRDARDVVDSELDGMRQGAWAATAFPGGVGIGDEQRVDYAARAAHRWLMRTEVIQRALVAHRGPKLTLRYEDLRRDPELHLRRVLEWLELPFAEDRLTDWVERHSFGASPARPVGSHEFVRAAEPGGWRKRLSEEERAAIEGIVGPKLRELGYETR